MPEFPLRIVHLYFETWRRRCRSRSTFFLFWATTWGHLMNTVKLELYTFSPLNSTQVYSESIIIILNRPKNIHIYDFI